MSVAASLGATEASLDCMLVMSSGRDLAIFEPLVVILPLQDAQLSASEFPERSLVSLEVPSRRSPARPLSPETMSCPANFSSSSTERERASSKRVTYSEKQLSKQLCRLLLNSSTKSTHRFMDLT